MMKKRFRSGIIVILVALLTLFNGCSGKSTANSSQLSSGPVVGSMMQETASDSDKTTDSGNAENADQDDDTDEWDNIGTITLGTSISFTGKGISTNSTGVIISDGGDYTVTGTLTDGMICVDTTEKVKLRLSGVNITNSSGPAIFFLNAKKAFITLTEGTDNYLADGSNYTVEAKAALFSNDTLKIKGNGSLQVNGNYMHGIASDDDIIIENGTISIKSVTDGLHANDNVTVDGGSITVSSSSDGIDSEGDVVVNGGSFEISAGDDGMHADTDLTVNDGEININDSYEGLEGKNTLTVDAGTIRINASDDALNSGSNIVINNGYIYVDCNGDGFDSNCDMTINGGTIVIYSGNNANGPLDIGDRTGTFTINGGTVVASGGNMGITTSESSAQYSIWIGSSLAANTLVNISAQDGSEITTFSLVKSSSLIFYSSDKLTGNATYNINTGGSYSGKAVDGVYSSGTYTAGSLLGTATMNSKSVSIGQSSFGGSGGGSFPGGGGGGSGNKPGRR